MDCRDKFRAVMSFADGEHSLRWELGYWHATIMRWYGEGLPSANSISESPRSDYAAVHGPGLHWQYGSDEIRDKDVASYFDFDESMIRLPIYLGPWPPFQVEVLDDEGDIQVIRDQQGIVKRVRKDCGSIPRFLDHPVKDRDSWEEVKSRLQPQTESRIQLDSTKLAIEEKQ